MTNPRKTSATKFLALALLSAMSFLASVGPASASTSPLPKGTVADALTPKIGPDAARLVAQQIGNPSESTGRHLYYVMCVAGVGSVWVGQVGGTHVQAFASFECSGDWYNEGSIG